jgi:hypothetical protein
MANLIGKNVLIVDEVDDTRTTLEYAVRELEKDVEAASKGLGRQGEKTNFSIFVLHNKDKAKKGNLPQDILKGRYIAAKTVGDVWINYPWEATYVMWDSGVIYRVTDFCVGTSTSTTVFPESRRRSNRYNVPEDDLRRKKRRIRVEKHDYSTFEHLRAGHFGVGGHSWSPLNGY